MNHLFTISATILIGVMAWVIRFAIKEYPIFKKLKLPSRFFLYGGCYLCIFLIWNLSAHKVFNKISVFIPAPVLPKARESVSNLMADEFTAYFFIGTFFFTWGLVLAIDKFAKFINDERKNTNTKRNEIDE
jgi:hypothetical protein